MLMNTVTPIQDMHVCLSFLEKDEKYWAPTQNQKNGWKYFLRKDISSYDISAVVIFGFYSQK